MGFIVGIDGPAGSGKEKIANLIGLTNIDTGITYRCVALKALRENAIQNGVINKEKTIELSKSINIDIKNTPNGDIVFLDGENVTKEIREKEVTMVVSPVSSIKEVRIEMVNLQRKLAIGKDIIMEGRDICTYVFPNADIKIYLDATEEERARRRYKEMQEKKIEMSYEEVLKNIRKRDENDKHKEIGSLKLAPDSIIVDTTNMTIEEVTEKIIEIINQKRNQK